MRKSRSESTSSLSCSSLLSNSLSPSSSFNQKPPLPESRPKFYKQAETIEPIRLESAKIIQNNENNFYKAIPVDPKTVCQELAPKRHSFSSGIALLKKIEAEEEQKRPMLDENRNEINLYQKEKSKPTDRRPSWTPTKQEINKQIAKLNDPNCPSTTQSKSFQLLQKAMESGDKNKDLVYYDKITKKTEVRRFSLDVNLATKPIRRLSKGNLINQESIEENTDQCEYQGKSNRSQSVTTAILNPFLTNLKTSSSNNSNQRRHSYMYRYGTNNNFNY